MRIHFVKDYLIPKVNPSNLKTVDIKNNTNINKMERCIYIIEPNQDNTLGSVIVKNISSSNSRPEVAKDIKDFKESHVISLYLFEPHFLNPKEADELNPGQDIDEMRLLCGISIGYCTLKPEGYMDYGVSVLNCFNTTSGYRYSIEENDYVEYLDSAFSYETDVLMRNPYMNSETEFIGCINPICFTDEHEYYLYGKNRDKGHLQIQYKMNDFVNKNNKDITKIYKYKMTESEEENSFYYLDEYKLMETFEFVIFTSLLYDLSTITVIIDSGNFNVDWNTIRRSKQYDSIKNSMDIRLFLSDLSDLFESFKNKYFTSFDEYYILIHVNTINCTMEVIQKITGEKRRFYLDKGHAIGSLLEQYAFYKAHIIKNYLNKLKDKMPTTLLNIRGE